MRACSTVVFGPASCCRHHALDAGHAAGTVRLVHTLDSEHESRLLKKA
jgi:hypothetical protein